MCKIFKNKLYITYNTISFQQYTQFGCPVYLYHLCSDQDSSPLSQILIQIQILLLLLLKNYFQIFLKPIMLSVEGGLSTPSSLPNMSSSRSCCMILLVPPSLCSHPVCLRGHGMMAPGFLCIAFPYWGYVNVVLRLSIVPLITRCGCLDGL